MRVQRAGKENVNKNEIYYNATKIDIRVTVLGIEQKKKEITIYSHEK